MRDFHLIFIFKFNFHINHKILGRKKVKVKAGVSRTMKVHFAFSAARFWNMLVNIAFTYFNHKVVEVFLFEARTAK